MMNESVKTTMYVGAAAVISLIAYITQPRGIVEDRQKLGTGPTEALFASFEDPLVAKSLEIVKFDEKLGEIHTFKVAQTSNGRWVIPSHSDYPADAEKQLKDAATSLIGLTPIGIASDLPEDHKMYGVIEPHKEKLKLGDQGVGTLVKVQDEKGKNLANLVIGNKVKNSDTQRFARIPTQDRVYVVTFNLDKLPTDFDNWIEKDLLKLNPFDVERIRLRDYSVVTTNRGLRPDMRLEAAVHYNSTDSKWELDELATFAPNTAKKIPTQLLEDEELNKEKLDALKTALDELKIVDVQRKPNGLSADLRAEENFLKDEEGRQSLFTRGFFFAAGPTGTSPEMYSANGEVYVGMKEGYEYILRFGNIAGTEKGSDEGKLNRYLFVTARLDESKFPPPVLEPEPSLPANVPGPQPPAKKDGEKNGDGAAEDEPKKDEAKAGDKPADEKPAAEEKPAKDDTADKKEEKTEEKKPDPQAELDRIKKENERKLNEWKEKKKKAADQVADLNARFADWYYVISEDTYKKIHLGRTDIIKEKSAAKEEGFGTDAFRKLEADGLNKPPAAPDKK